MLKRTKIFNGLWVDHLDLADTALLKPGSQIVSLNIEQLVLAEQDPGLLSIFQDAEYLISDGIGVVFTLKYLFGVKDAKKLAGIDLAEKLIEEKSRIAFLGSGTKQIDKLKNIYSEKLVFAHDGYFALDQKDDLLAKLISQNPDLLLVGMGSPRQEKIIYELKTKLPNTIMMGVGGALDLWSGSLKRAPKIMIDLNLEWLFRIIQEPYRVKRFIYSVRGYILLLIKKLVSS